MTEKKCPICGNPMKEMSSPIFPVSASGSFPLNIDTDSSASYEIKTTKVHWLCTKCEYTE